MITAEDEELYIREQEFLMRDFHSFDDRYAVVYRVFFEMLQKKIAKLEAEIEKLKGGN